VTARRCAYFPNRQHRYTHNGRCPCGEESPGEQGNLFDTPRPDPARNTTATSGRHPETSYKAAAQALPRTGTQRAKVLKALMEAWPGGLTDEELQTRTNIILQSEIPARNSLVKDGWARDSGHRRNTASGNPAIVWTYRPENNT
jgi:hypothetical protein